MELVDLKTLSARESEQAEWKENVADIDDVVATISAFANDWSNLGGGYVVCGAKEEKDEYGFQRLSMVGLTAARLKEVEGKVLAGCRDRVSPSIAPLVQELPTGDPSRRVLVFIMPATASAHTFRRRDERGMYYVRIGRETREARNGILLQLLVRKGAVEHWDKRVCTTATVDDLDLLALRDALQRMGVFQADRGIDSYLTENYSLSPFVPSLCVREPLTGVMRPRNFAMLLFGRNTQLHVSGAYSIFSVYPGTDRSGRHAERKELAGTLIDQARRLIELLDVQSYVAFDKSDRTTPNAVKFPPQALNEAMINALAHRDYENVQPSRITVFTDRIEVLSPGSLPIGVDVEDFREGRAAPKRRNQSLAWFFSRLQLAQAEGQGIPNILNSMRREGCPPPQFQANELHVVCVLPVHPRLALAREHREIEESISLGAFERAQKALRSLLERDPLNARTVLLFVAVQRALDSPEPVFEYLEKHQSELGVLPPPVLRQLAGVLRHAHDPTDEDRSLARRLYLEASNGRFNEREIRQFAAGLTRAENESDVIDFLDTQFLQHPELRNSPSLLRIRGTALRSHAIKCGETATNEDLSAQTRMCALEDRTKFLAASEQDFQRAMALTTDAVLSQEIQTHLDFIGKLKPLLTPPAT